MIYKRTVTEKVTIKELFNKLGIDEVEHAQKILDFPLQVKTPYGYKDIAVAFRTEKQKLVTSYFKNNKTLITSDKHLLKVNGNWKAIKDIEPDDIIETETGITSLKKKYYSNKEEILYDISVKDVHCYYTNGILSHNSWVLTRLGTEALRQNKNVIHFTLELNESYINRRYASCISGIDFQTISKKKDLVKKMVEEVKKKPDFGKLKVKYFPIKTVSPLTLKSHIEKCQTIDGVIYDLVIVDYADILRPIAAEKNSNSYSEAGSIYEDLRMVAGELQIPCWSASQCNRNSAEENIITAGDIADSYRKIMTADFIISVSRKIEDKASHTARFHVVKNRFGCDGITFPSKFNSSNGVIEMYDPASKEGLDMQAKMDGEGDTIKKMLSDKWQKHKNVDDELADIEV